jgi:hypothetical protein
VSDRMVAQLLREEGYSLRGNANVAEGAQHADRDAQFRYINLTAGEFLGAGDPVVSVGAKKKEKIGQFANGGAEWRARGQPERVNVHDFPSDAAGKAIPYGIYDLGANSGWVSVGTDPRHLRVRGAGAAPLVAGRRAGLLPGRPAAADLRRLRRIERRPSPRLKSRAGQAGRRDRAGGHLLALPAGHVQRGTE